MAQRVHSPGGTARFTVSLDRAVNCLFVRHYELLDYAALRARMQAVSELDGVTVGTNALIDLSGCRAELDAADLRRLAHDTTVLAGRRGASRTAIVTSGDLQYGLSRMVKAMVDSSRPELQMQPFRSRDEACRWLGLPEGYRLPFED